MNEHITMSVTTSAVQYFDKVQRINHGVSFLPILGVGDILFSLENMCLLDIIKHDQNLYEAS